MTTSKSQLTQTPISRLPHELLISIFFICKIADYHNRYNRALIAASQVSRQWRAVTIACPDLWTNIYIQCSRWAEEMLQRSQNALIHIYLLPFITPDPTQFIASRNAFREMHRLKGLTLNAPAATLQALFEALPDAAPHLEHLELDYIAASNVDYSSLIPFKGATTGAVRGTTHIRHLELKGFQMNWESPFLRGLTHLSLTLMSFVTRPTLLMVIDVLQNMPMLEHLYFGSRITSKRNAKLSETPLNHIAQLPRLTALEFRYAFGLTTCTHLMERLLLPSNCRIRIQLPDYSNSSNRFGIYTERLLAAITTFKLVPPEGQVGILFSTAQVDFFSQAGAFRFRLSQTHLPPYHDVEYDSPLLELDRIQLIGTKANTIRILAEALPLPHLTSIFVGTCISSSNSFAKNIGRGFWKAVLPNLLNVKQVEVGGDSTFSFLDVLLRLDTKHALIGNENLQQSDSRVCLPLLESIGIRSTDFRNAIYHSFSIEKLHDLFTRKFVHRPNFRGILLTCCYLTADEVRPIAKVINSWDGCVSDSYLYSDFDSADNSANSDDRH